MYNPEKPANTDLVEDIDLLKIFLKYTNIPIYQYSNIPIYQYISL